MRLQHVTYLHGVVIEESVKCFELPLRTHRFWKAAPGFARQRCADALKPRATTSITQRRTAEFVANVLEHEAYGITRLCGWQAEREMCGIVSLARTVTCQSRYSLPVTALSAVRLP